MIAYLDTNIWVYAFEHGSSFGSSARAVVQRLRAEGYRIAARLFVLNELLVLPMRRRDEFSIAAYLQVFNSPSVELLPYTVTAARIYSRLRAFDRVKALDALHLATAAEASADLFMTEDLQLLRRRVPGIGKITDLSGLIP